MPVFKALGEEELRRVGEVAVPRCFERRPVIFRAGDASDTGYVVRSGQIRAVREHPDIAGSARASASRLLAVLERAGVVKPGRGRVLEPSALDGYVH